MVSEKTSHTFTVTLCFLLAGVTHAEKLLKEVKHSTVFPRTLTGNDTAPKPAC